MYHKNAIKCASHRICDTDAARHSAGGIGQLQMFIIPSQKLTDDVSQVFLGEECSPFQASIEGLWHFVSLARE